MIPSDIGDTASAGTEADVSARDHTDALPTDNTLEFDATSDDELGVNVQDVIEHLQERIRYHFILRRLRLQECRGFSRPASTPRQAIPESASRRWMPNFNRTPPVVADSFLVSGLFELGRRTTTVKAKLFTSRNHGRSIGAGDQPLPFAPLRTSTTLPVMLVWSIDGGIHSPGQSC